MGRGSPSAGGSGEHCKLPQRGSGGAPTASAFLDALRAQKRVLWAVVAFFALSILDS